MMTFPTYGDTFTIHAPKYPKSTWHGIPQRNSWANPRFLDSQHVIIKIVYIYVYIVYITYTVTWEKKSGTSRQKTRWPVDPKKSASPGHYHRLMWAVLICWQLSRPGQQLGGDPRKTPGRPQGFNDRNPTCVQNASFHPTGEFDANHGDFSY